MCSWILCWQFLWYLRGCHCCDSQNPMIEKSETSNFSISKNHLQDAFILTSHSTIQHVYQNPSQIEGFQVAISHLLRFGEELRSTLAVWDWQLQMAQLAKPPCILCPTIRHWKNVLGNRFFHDTSHKGWCSPPPTCGQFDQQLLRIKNQVWGLWSSSYLHIIFSTLTTLSIRLRLLAPQGCGAEAMSKS